jgi:alkanesulfonate monooxygenase SsuD/methylene tetrahydromethanopterin reductase-like flavin-dependent oxidoreductase (luciferase family)
MKASLFGSMMYVSPQEIPGGWPVAPAHYDRTIGLRSFHEGLEQIEFADRLGYDWVSFSEHHYSMTSVTPNPAITAAAALSRVRQARIAMLGHTLPLNNPVRVAEELAMLDNLSDGRLVVGWLRGTPNEYQAYGVNPAETREKMIESMELILRAWSEPQPFGWEGRYYQYRTVSVWPRPLQQPYPRSYVLGTSRESAAFAARHHLGLGFPFEPPSAFAESYQFYKEQCRQAGWEPTADDIVYRGTVYVAETDERAIAEGTPHLSAGRITANVLALQKRVSAAVSSADPNPRLLGAAYVSPESWSAINFAGSPDTVVRKLRQCHDECGAGVVDLMFQGPGLQHAKVMRSIELFGKEVLPRMREF